MKSSVYSSIQSNSNNIVGFRQAGGDEDVDDIEPTIIFGFSDDDGAEVKFLNYKININTSDVKWCFLSIQALEDDEACMVMLAEIEEIEYTDEMTCTHKDFESCHSTFKSVLRKTMVCLTIEYFLEIL